MSYLLSGAKSIVKNRLHAFIDANVTSNLKPFLENGEGPDGKEVSDFVVNEDSDISVENMVVRAEVVNETLMKSGSPFRLKMLVAKRIFFDIPWGNITSRDANWILEVDGLHVVMEVLECDGWSVDGLREARQASVEKALAALTKKLKALDAKPKKGGFVDTIKRRLMEQVNLKVNIKNVHLRIERVNG